MTIKQTLQKVRNLAKGEIPLNTPANGVKHATISQSAYLNGRFLSEIFKKIMEYFLKKTQHETHPTIH